MKGLVDSVDRVLGTGRVYCRAEHNNNNTTTQRDYINQQPNNTTNTRLIYYIITAGMLVLSLLPFFEAEGDGTRD